VAQDRGPYLAFVSAVMKHRVPQKEARNLLALAETITAYEARLF
jgi:hypothetical protein